MNILSRTVFSLIFITLPFAAFAVDGKGFYNTKGSGTNSCAKWTAEKQTDSLLYAAFNQWVLGYITAVNSEAWHESADVAEGTDNAGLLGWIDNYCANHPLDNVTAAASALTREMSGRYFRSHAPKPAVDTPTPPPKGTEKSIGRRKTPADE